MPALAWFLLFWWQYLTRKRLGSARPSRSTLLFGRYIVNNGDLVLLKVPDRVNKDRPCVGFLKLVCF